MFAIKMVPCLSQGHSESIEKVKGMGFIKKRSTHQNMLTQSAQGILDAAERATLWLTSN